MAALMYKIANQSPSLLADRLPDLPAELESDIGHSLKNHPEQRYATGQDDRCGSSGHPPCGATRRIVSRHLDPDFMWSAAIIQPDRRCCR